jgi:hypothetical protein
MSRIGTELPPRRLDELVAAIDRPALGQPPVELRDFARKEAPHHRCGYERRRERRYSLITNVIALPLDETLCSAGEPFIAISSGMSAGGIRLIHTGPPATDLLFLEIDRQPVKLLLTVLRSRAIGPCFEIAGRLIPADAAVAKVVPPGLMAADCQAVTAAVGGARQADATSPSVDELAHWAGLAAAVQMIHAERDHHDGIFQVFAGSDSSH